MRWRGLFARWRRPDGTALNYLVMAFTAVFCVVVAMWLFPEALVGGRQNAVAWVSAAAFTVVGIYVLGRGTVTRVALHPLAWTAIVGGNSIVASFEDPLTRVIASVGNLMIVMFLATSMSRRAVAVYGGSCVTAAACTIAALPGAPVMVGFRVVVLTIALGFPIGFFLVLRGELDEALRVARVLATKDTLTGLLNRRGLEEAFPLIASSTVRDAQYLAALVCDLDHFKKINDTHGHDTGDEVLALVGKAVSMRTRPGDVLVRLGGEEIAVIAAVKHGEEARLLAERLRQDVQDACRRWSATMSVGIALVADIPPDEYATALSRLLADADKRLYEAKQMGRNRVVGPDPIGPSVPRQGREVLSEAPGPRTSIGGRTASPAPPDAAEVPPTSPGGNRPWGPMGTSAGT